MDLKTQNQIAANIREAARQNRIMRIGAIVILIIGALSCGLSIYNLILTAQLL